MTKTAANSRQLLYLLAAIIFGHLGVRALRDNDLLLSFSRLLVSAGAALGLVLMNTEKGDKHPLRVAPVLLFGIGLVIQGFLLLGAIFR